MEAFGYWYLQFSRFLQSDIRVRANPNIKKITFKICEHLKRDQEVKKEALQFSLIESVMRVITAKGDERTGNGTMPNIDDFITFTDVSHKV